MSVCVACQKPLVVEIDDSDDEDFQMGASSNSAAAASGNSFTVPDDVHLNCGCHFHWQCLLESYNITECPACSRNLLSVGPSGNQQILCAMHNEGGVQEDLDILPLLTEESYLKAYPEDRKARAFLEFCNEGDIKAIVDLVHLEEEEDEDEDDEDDEDHDMGEGSGRQVDLLRYQDPIGDMQSGLHCAVSNGHTDVAWLLLYLASRLDQGQFPPQLLQVAENMGIRRNEEEILSKPDIRTLRDSDGKSAEDIAREKGGVWQDWIGRGWLVI